MAALIEAFRAGGELSTRDIGECDIELLHTKASKDRSDTELLDARLYVWCEQDTGKIRHAIAVQFNDCRGPHGDVVAYEWAQKYIDHSERLDAYELWLKKPADDFADFRWIVHSFCRN